MNSNLPTGNLNNKLSDRPCVRQSRFYRQYESGNSMKDILGQGGLKWNETKKEGVFKGKPAYDSHQHIPSYTPPEPEYYDSPPAPAPAPRPRPTALSYSDEDERPVAPIRQTQNQDRERFQQQPQPRVVQTTSTRVNANASGNPITWEGDAAAAPRRGRRIQGYSSPTVGGGVGHQQYEAPQRQLQGAKQVGGRNGAVEDVAGRGRDFSHQKSYVSTSIW